MNCCLVPVVSHSSASLASQPKRHTSPGSAYPAVTYTAAACCVRWQRLLQKRSQGRGAAARPKAIEVAPAFGTCAAQLHVFTEGVWTTFIGAAPGVCNSPAQANSGSRARVSRGMPSDCPVRSRECQSASFFARPGPIYTALLNPPTSLHTDQSQVREKAQAPDSGRTPGLVRSPSEEATHVRNALRVGWASSSARAVRSLSLQCLGSSGGPPSTTADCCVRWQPSPPKTFSRSRSGAARPKAMEVALAFGTWAAQLHVSTEGAWTTFAIAHTNKLLENLELHPVCATRKHHPAQACSGSRAPLSSDPSHTLGSPTRT